MSFYYLHAEDGSNVEAVIAEVTNTPWGDRRAYVLDGRERVSLEGTFSTRMHVSPFMPMEQTYRGAMPVHPPPAAATLARTYWNALRLRLKGASYHPRPAPG